MIEFFIFFNLLLLIFLLGYIIKLLGENNKIKDIGRVLDENGSPTRQVDWKIKI